MLPCCTALVDQSLALALTYKEKRQMNDFNAEVWQFISTGCPVGQASCVVGKHSNNECKDPSKPCPKQHSATGLTATDIQIPMSDATAAGVVSPAATGYVPYAKQQYGDLKWSPVSTSKNGFQFKNNMTVGRLAYYSCMYHGPTPG